MNPIVMLAVLIAVCLAVGAFGSVFTASSVNGWYPTIHKPSWTPPSWVFAPVWTALYIMMGIAAWFVWRKRENAGAKSALILFAVQLALNAAWSPLFFGLKNPLAGLLTIILLWAFLAAAILSFWRISRAAAALLAPYWLWVSFASALNLAIWRMNG